MSEEGENELQERAEQQTENELRKESLVLFEIVPKELRAALSRCCFCIVLSIELFCRFKKKGDTFLLTVGLSTYPMLAELLLGIGNKSFARVGNIYGIFSFFVLFYFFNSFISIRVIPDYKVRDSFT